MYMTLHPSDEFVMHVGIACRVWKGKLHDGSEVTALIACVTAPGNLLGLTPIPPPAKRWTHSVLYAMTRLWQLGDRLRDDEARQLATLGEGWVIERERSMPRLASGA